MSLYFLTSLPPPPSGLEFTSSCSVHFIRHGLLKTWVSIGKNASDCVSEVLRTVAHHGNPTKKTSVCVIWVVIVIKGGGAVIHHLTLLFSEDILKQTRESKRAM